MEILKLQLIYEKDPKTIAAEKLLKPSNYPKCLLCMENEGYQGRVNYPARANHRIIRMNLGEELWGFQYSPYSYFNEHAIFFNSEHVPMAITPKTFEQLLDIIENKDNINIEADNFDEIIFNIMDNSNLEFEKLIKYARITKNKKAIEMLIEIAR
mgnify:CR=1 FL=1